MTDKTKLIWYYVALFIAIMFFQLVFELIFGDAVTAGWVSRTVITSAIVTVLFMLFDRWRRRRASTGQ
jgi:dolichyl-phosphate-mannose--protein O-mannosyl transferase